MTGMAAAIVCAAFTSCSRDLETNQGTAVAETVEETYEKAFITHFGQPSENRTWGFGESGKANTRGDAAPTISETGTPTFNAKVTASVNKVANVINESSYSFMNNYSNYIGSGWTDNFYQIYGTVTGSTYSDEYYTQIRNLILQTIPERHDNRSTASETGYSVTTKGGKVTLTPIYHNSSSGDVISYYYYPATQNPSVEEIKAMPKYTIGNMCDPTVCQVNSDEAHLSFDRKTYTLVFKDPSSGEIKEEFPAGYKINFIVTNSDLNNPRINIYNGEEVAASTTSIGKFAIEEDAVYKSGDEVSINNCGKIKFGNTLSIPGFKTVKKGSTFTSDNNTTFGYYTEGNGVNGGLLGGSTTYYLVPKSNGTMTVGVSLSGGKTLKVVKLNNIGDTSGTEILSFTNPDADNSYNGTISFDTDAWGKYAVYAEGSKLGFYSFEFDNGNGSIDRQAFTNFHSTLNLYYGYYYSTDFVQLYMGNTPASFSAANGNSELSPDYTAYTSGAAAQGGLFGGATTYYIQPSNTGKVRVAVSLGSGKKFTIMDLGTDNWNATSGEALANYNEITRSSKYNGTFEFDVEAGHIYAVYSSDSRLGFYGCEFLTSNGSNSSNENVSTTSIADEPEFYGDGRLNTEIHNTFIDGVRWKSDAIIEGVPDNTSHIAVFNIQGKNYIGFEDWVDFDYNDVIFEVTNTEGGKPIEPDEPIDETDEIMVIAEDLTIDDVKPDFDFNDVVYSVKWNKTQGKVTIKLYAAGGTLPLYIGGTKENDYTDGYEVHAKFAEENPDKVITTGTMINTYENRHDQYKMPSFDVTNFSGENIYQIANSIKVAVKKYGEMIELKAPKGGVPTKIAVKMDFLNSGWCNERQDIDNKFTDVQNNPLFKSYVKGELGDDWYTKIKTKQQ